MERTRLDGRWQWSRRGNVWQNAALRTAAYLALAPARWLHDRMLHAPACRVE